MDANQVNQVITQIGLSAVFLFMLWKLWVRHMQMTDKFIAALMDEIAAQRGVKAVEKQEGS